jgi:hypothetical protein
MNTFWLIHDDGESEKFSHCLHQLENDGKTSVLSSGVHGNYFAVYVITTSLKREDLLTFFQQFAISYRFSSADGIAEYLRGFITGFKMSLSNK